MKNMGIRAGFAVALVASVVMGIAGANAFARGELRITTKLAGAAIGHLTPKGTAEYRERADRNGLKVEVQNVNLPVGTTLHVLVDDAPVGDITLTALKKGELELRSQDGAVVPTVTIGTAVVVTDDAGTTIVAGTF